MPSFKERIDRHDREIAAIRKLIHAGMKMIVKHDENFLRLEEEQLAFRKEMRELRAAQRETERLIQAFVRGGNGHKRGPIDQ